MIPYGHRSSSKPQAFYEDNLSVFSASSFNRQVLNNGNKILLPASALSKLICVRQTGPMMFKIQSPQNQKFSYVGVLEFVADEGTCVVPDWLFDQLLFREEQQIIVSHEKNLPSGKLIQIQPHETAFIDLQDPRLILETSFRNYVCLTQGETITINFQKKSYMIDIVKVEPQSDKQAVCINEVDVEIDFLQPLDAYQVPIYLFQKKSDKEQLKEQLKEQSQVFFQGKGVRIDEFIGQNKDQQNTLKNKQNYENQMLNPDQEQNFLNDALRQQNLNQKNQDLNSQEQFNNQPINQEKLLLIYRKNMFKLKFQYQMTQCKQLKKIISEELKELGITINSDFCQLLDEEIIIPDELAINPRYTKTITLINHKEMIEKQPEWWCKCLTRQEQIQSQLAQSKKTNEKCNLKATLQFWDQKQNAICKIFPLISTPNISRIFIIGPKNTPYSDGIYELLCKIPEEYPFQPPQFYFVTQIYHPNIVNGALPSLESFWRQKLTLKSLIQQIISFLSEPSLEISLNKEYAQKYLTHRDIFNQIAETWKNQYAKPNLDDIIKSLFGSVVESNQLKDELLNDFKEWIINF